MPATTTTKAKFKRRCGTGEHDECSERVCRVTRGSAKAKSYKKAELQVAYLQRRMQGLLDDIEIQKRGWAEYTQRKLEEIHDKLLSGVMRR